MNSTNNKISTEKLESLPYNERSHYDKHNHGFKNYYNDFKPLYKRNAYANHRMGKRKQLQKHKKPSERLRVHPVKRKGKIGQSKINLKNLKKDEYQGTSMYENNKSPFKDNKSKYNAKGDFNMIYTKSKTTQASKENVANKFSLLNIQEEIKTDKDRNTNVTDNTYKSEDGNQVRNTIITNAKENEEKDPELYETEHTNKVYDGEKNDAQETQDEGGNSENIDEYIKKSYGNKLKIKYINNLNGLDRNAEDTDSSTQDGKLDIPNMSKTKSSDQPSEVSSLSVKSGTNIEHMNSHRTVMSKLSSPNEIKIQEKMSHTQKDKSVYNDEVKKHKNAILGNKGEQSKHNDISEKSNGFENKEGFREIPRDSNELHGKSNRESINNLDDSSSDKQKNVNKHLEHATHLRTHIANKRNQRDLNKRLRKHNNFKNHNLQEGTVFGYQTNSDEERDSNIREVHKSRAGYKTKDDDISEYRPRKFDVNSNLNDKYSYKEPFDEEIGALGEEETNNNKIYNPKNTFSRQSQESRQRGKMKDKCVEYKAEKVTKQTTCATESTTEKCTTKVTTCATKRTTVKAKSTPQTQTCNKTLTTKKIEPENKTFTSNTSGVPLDIFDKYLCGQLADEFVDAVMDKVKRSRKIYKELGFHNDSEESCDRCIETKPNKMPEKETLKTSMGKCLKNKEHKSGCFTCYTVPKPMEKMLSLLVLYEKEHENSVYSKIRDDSSFIFTRDYPEQLNPNDNIEGNKNKYIGDRDSFSKETIDKQDLREDSNEDKHDYQVANVNSLEDEDNTLEAESKYVEYSTDSVMSKNENMDQISDTTLNVQNVVENKDINYRNNGKHSLDLVNEREENDNNDEDLNVAPRSKYSSLKEQYIDERDDSLDIATIKQRRKAFKSDNISGPKNTYNIPKDPETKAVSNLKNHYLDFNGNKLSKARYDYDNQGDIPKVHNHISTLENLKQHHEPLDQYQGRWLPNGKNKLSPFNYLSNDKLSYKKTHFSYPSEDYNDEYGHLHTQNNGHSVANGFMSTGWDSDEYQLMPKQPDNEAFQHNLINSVPRKRYQNSDYEERLNMVKRESEPSYEDEPLFIEIPNIEYDLY